jgi:hypothetical protein
MALIPFGVQLPFTVWVVDSASGRGLGRREPLFRTGSCVTLLLLTLLLPVLIRLPPPPLHDFFFPELSTGGSWELFSYLCLTVGRKDPTIKLEDSGEGCSS